MNLLKPLKLILEEPMVNSVKKRSRNVLKYLNIKPFYSDFVFSTP